MTLQNEFLVRVMDVSKEYAFGKQKLQALKNVSLAVLKSEFLAIAGPSGSGKSTMLNLIGCIDTPTSGRIYIGDQSTSDKTPDQLADLRAMKIGFIFQTFNLLPVLSAFENVEYPILRLALDKKKRRERVSRYLELVDVAEFAKHRPNQLSGGQRQRVAIARALITRPSIVLADEPTANLDHKTGGNILELMRRINQEKGTTFIFSTHDPRVMEMAGRVIRISDGEIATNSQ
ncbi:MAG: ABC transporter ATP-binding protein [Gammaproteobacteria bacterium]|nr:MAG: ABC transporter ATP-binding protein [Gammaproteobacteria bacterium]